MSSIPTSIPPHPTAALLSSTAAFATLLTSTGHYGSDLWDSASAVADQSETSKGWLLKMTKFLKDKAELDKEYAKGLKKLVLKLAIPDVPRVQDIPIPPSVAVQAAVELANKNAAANSPIKPTPSNDSSQAVTVASPQVPFVDPRSFDRFMMAFRNLHMTLATNFEILSAKIVEQVYKPLAIHRDAHALNSKKLIGELEKYTGSYQRYLDSLLQSRAACQKACQESEIHRRKLDTALQAGTASGVATPYSTSREYSSDFIASLKSDAANLVKKALKADAVYIQSVKNMRGFRMQSDATLAHLLDQFEQIEQSKLTTAKEILHHYLIIQQQMFSSNLKNLTAVQNVIEKVNPQTDLQYFIMKFKSGKLPIPLPEYQVFKGHPNYAKVVQEEEKNDVGIVGDITNMSSTQFEEEDHSQASTSSTTSISSSAASQKAKSSPWGWLNTIASVLPGNTKPRTAIDHDSESVLTRGSNYYEQREQQRELARMASANASSGGDEDDANAGDDLSSSPPPPANVFLRKDGDEPDEEKTPERKIAEETLQTYFDAITGRMPANSTPSPATPATTSSSTPTDVTYSASLERDLTPAEETAAKQLLATPDGRKSFSSILNKQRNTHGGLRLTPTALHRLAALTRVFLDEAEQSMHVSPTQLVMIMSQSFFTEVDEVPNTNTPTTANDSENKSPSDRRVYLMSLIKDHDIWKATRFWEEAFFDAFNSKIKKTSASKVHKWYSDLEQAESLHTRKQVCFSTLSTFSHNMNDFGLPAKTIVEFVEKLASINELEVEQLMMLRSMEVYANVNINELDPAIASNLIRDGVMSQESGGDSSSFGEFESVENEEESSHQQTNDTHLP